MTTQGTKPLELDDLPNDMFGVTTSILPIYRRKGEYNLYTVNKYWSTHLPKSKRITSADIVASCQSREDALFILNDPIQAKQFSLEEFMILIAYVPEITKEILPRFGKLIDMGVLKKMMAKHLWLCQFIFDIDVHEIELKHNLESQATAMLNWAKADISIAEALIRECPTLKNHNLVRESTDKHPLIQKMIRILREYISGFNFREVDLLLELGKSHLPIAQAIFALPADKKGEMCGIVDVNGMLAEMHLPIAETIWNDFLKGGTLRAVLWRVVPPHPTIAKDIFQNEAVINRLNVATKLKLGEKYLFFAQYLLENEDLLPSALIHLGVEHLEIAQLILNTPALKEKVEEVPEGIVDIESAHQIKSVEERYDLTASNPSSDRFFSFISLAPIDHQAQEIPHITNYANIYTIALELAKEMHSTKSLKLSK